MPPPAIQELAQRLERSDPGDSRVQKELFERLRELRTALRGPQDAECVRCLEAASLLIAYLARMGSLAGDDVLPIAVRILRSAASPGAALPRRAAAKGASVPLRSSTELVSDMLLGQILLKRGYLSEAQIQKALDVQRASGQLFGEVLIQIGAVTWDQVVEGLQYQDACRRIRENFVDPRGKKVPSLADLEPAGSLKLVGEVLLGEVLVERRAITRKQLERALDVQRATGVRIGEALVQTGAATWGQIEQALRIQRETRKRGS